MMNRREAMVRLGAVAAGSLAGVPFSPVFAKKSGPDIAAFASSFEQVPQVYPPTSVRFDKALPAGLSGTLFRNGPGLMQRGNQRYQHWFDGDGMIQSFHLSGQTMTHKGRLVKTSRLAAETQANRYLWPGFGSSFDNMRSVRRADDMNVANISVLPLPDELLALWEGGSAWSVNPETLETRGRKVFSGDTDGLSFSAHPRVDANGRIWNFGYLSGSGKLILYDIARTGQLNRVKIIDAPNADMVHDFAMTERYLIFVLSPIRYEEPAGQETRAFVERLSWVSDSPVIVMVVDKESLAPVTQFEVAPFFAFHFGNAFEDGQTVRVDVARAPGFDSLMSAISRATQGKAILPMKQERAMQLVLDMQNKTARTEALPVVAVDFPRFDQRFTGRRASHLFLLGEADNRPSSSFGLGQLIALDHKNQRVQRFPYGDHVIAEEHVFVPAPGGEEGLGWVLGTSFDTKQRKTCLSVFDSRAIDAGPISTAQLPYHLPLGLHGQFVSA